MRTGDDVSMSCSCSVLSSDAVHSSRSSDEKATSFTPVSCDDESALEVLERGAVGEGMTVWRRTVPSEEAAAQSVPLVENLIEEMERVPVGSCWARL